MPGRVLETTDNEGPFRGDEFRRGINAANSLQRDFPEEMPKLLKRRTWRTARRPTFPLDFNLPEALHDVE